MRVITSPRLPDLRADSLLARVRTRQLETALHGRVLDSARYAQRADRIRRAREAVARN